MAYVALSKYLQKMNESITHFELLAIEVSQRESSAGKYKQPVGGGVANRTYLGLESEMKKTAVAGIEPQTFRVRCSRLAAYAIRTTRRIAF